MKHSVQPLGAANSTLQDKLQRVERNIEQNAGSFGSGLAVCVCGFPGAGKSTASHSVNNVFDEKSDNTLHVGVDRFGEAFDVDRYDSKNLIGKIDSDIGLISPEYAVFDGVVSTDTFEYISKFFDELQVFYISSNHAARHARLIEQARSEGFDLDNFSRESLRERDMEANAAGLNDIEQGLFFDTELENIGIDCEEFRSYVKYASRELFLDYKHDNL